MPTETEDDRKTLPPNPLSEPPPALSIMPSDTLRQLPGYDPNQFLHVALAAAADAAHEIREARKSDASIALLLDHQTEKILKETSADYDSLRSSITGVQKSVDALVTRVGNTETQLDIGHKRFAAIDDELAALRSQLSRLEQLPAHLERLQTQIDDLRNEGNNVTETASPSGKQPAATEDPVR